MTPSRITAALLAGFADQLTHRDLAVLDTVGRARLITTRQIERACFYTTTPLANARQARRTLAKLEGLDLVTKLGRRVGGVRAGSASFTWSLGVAGQHLLGVGGPAGGTKRRSPWTPSQQFVAHHIAVSEIFVSLVEAERAGTGELLKFEAEPTCWRSYNGPSGEQLRLKPDAFVVTASAAFEDSWFVEVDLATESPAVLERKTKAYIAYHRSGREQRDRGVSPLVLFVVPDERRERVVAEVLSKLPTPRLALFRVVLASEAKVALMGGAT